jgi:hypothetical protein
MRRSCLKTLKILEYLKHNFYNCGGVAEELKTIKFD